MSKDSSLKSCLRASFNPPSDAGFVLPPRSVVDVVQRKVTLNLFLISLENPVQQSNTFH